MMGTGIIAVLDQMNKQTLKTSENRETFEIDFEKRVSYYVTDL